MFSVSIKIFNKRTVTDSLFAVSINMLKQQYQCRFLSKRNLCLLSLLTKKQRGPKFRNVACPGAAPKGTPQHKFIIYSYLKAASFLFSR